MKNSFSRIGYEYGIVFPTVIMLYLNINLRIPYRVSYILLKEDTYVGVLTLIDILIFSKY